MDKTAGKGIKPSKDGSTPQALEDIAKARVGTVWVREDGAICIDNECITLKREDDGSLGFDVDPNKCPCEVADALLDALADTVVQGKGISLTIKPREKA